MRTTTSLTADALASSLGESMVSLSPDQFAQLLPFLPDTPWTTTAVQVLTRRQGRVLIDSTEHPQNVVMIALGDPSARTCDQVFVLGTPESEALRSFMIAVRGPMEIVCDDSIGALLEQFHPDVRKRESVVHWFDRIEDADSVNGDTGARRLRISEAEQLAPLLPGWALRTFRTPKDLVSGGTVYVIEAEGRISAAGFTVDQSQKYERIAVSTRESVRGNGLGSKVAAKVLRAVADQGRIPCAVVDATDGAGLRVAAKLGFTRRAAMTTYVTTFKK